ncbi:hypothetical protein [Clostridium perfringens]|uniref:hypothetical protein n=1 Tax=Clostridium perfringens TaxID=1502 RepID=UPI001ABAC8E8|nr:hypothetical protein [Clostridium perfringens]MBO3323658.1 hypothetical protein [Clostridium perfringens]MBO3332861.1 hypothetical protein [Clostridium perfringens]MCX0386735.1 hypothetical protein [Clostridium perfringens]
MKTIVKKKRGIEELLKSGKILKNDLQSKLTCFGRNDWGVLNEDDKEEQNYMLLEGFYIKNRNPKLDEHFLGVYEIGNFIIWIGSKYDNEKEALIVTIGLPQEGVF